jgi:hypothetical protein
MEVEIKVKISVEALADAMQDAFDEYLQKCIGFDNVADMNDQEYYKLTLKTCEVIQDRITEVLEREEY